MSFCSTTATSTRAATIQSSASCQLFRASRRASGARSALHSRVSSRSGLRPPPDCPALREGRRCWPPGPSLKNTYCLARDGLAFLSQHIGDLENFETLEAFETSVAQLEPLLHTQPIALAYDLHPDYLSTRYAAARAERESRPPSVSSTITPISPPAWPMPVCARRPARHRPGL